MREEKYRLDVILKPRLTTRQELPKVIINVNPRNGAPFFFTRSLELEARTFPIYIYNGRSDMMHDVAS